MPLIRLIRGRFRLSDRVSHFDWICGATGFSNSATSLTRRGQYSNKLAKLSVLTWQIIPGNNLYFAPLVQFELYLPQLNTIIIHRCIISDIFYHLCTYYEHSVYFCIFKFPANGRGSASLFIEVDKTTNTENEAVDGRNETIGKPSQFNLYSRFIIGRVWSLVQRELCAALCAKLSLLTVSKDPGRKFRLSRE